MPSLRHALPLLGLLWALAPAPAWAQTDWLVIPFAGVKFGGATSIVDLELAAGQTTMTLGVSTAILTHSIIGLEAGLASMPGYLERGDQTLVTPSSYAFDVTGNVILTLPPGVTREGLRPYVLAGGGVIHAEASDVLNIFRIRRSVPAVTFGGGAIGYLTTSVGVRFDVRYLRSVAQDNEAALSVGRRISYWRGTVGLVLKL